MNKKNTAVKRILADVKELNKHPSTRYHAVPLEENMFEWHFTIRGPSETAFENGLYHGRILLPSEYPFKPPNIVFLTKNGRFEVGKKICLSISAYHEESWQPAWGVRTMLEAIISFLPSEGAGAIGALDWTAEERKKLADESRSYCCPACGNIDQLMKEHCEEIGNVDDKADSTISDQISQLKMSGMQSTSQSPQISDKKKLTEMNENVINSTFSMSSEMSQEEMSLEKITNSPNLSQKIDETQVQENIPVHVEVPNNGVSQVQHQVQQVHQQIIQEDESQGGDYVLNTLLFIVGFAIIAIICKILLRKLLS